MTSPLKVLVVEDDPDALSVMLQLIGCWDYAVEGAASGEQALQLVEADCPDVVISDLMMPGLSGLDLLRALRRIEKCVIIFVLLTGHGSVSTAVEALSEGADQVLLKPFDMDKLHALLQGYEQKKGEQKNS